jgi:YidC/Oxa1 family membrane protein insertase
LSYIKEAFLQFFNAVHAMLNSFIPDKGLSYGLAIILVTIIIRIVLLPLTIKQTRSTLVMSEIQPDVKKLQEKYKNDPQKSQEEMMKLYKEKGASPFSGCLPMLIQWPIFIALYFVFSTMTGLQGVKFIGIDLGGSNPVLAVLSGLTTFVSGYFSMPTNNADPAQARQTKIMNISMGFFMIYVSWKLKAALVLYWIVNNLIQVTQTVIMKKMDKKIVKTKEIEKAKEIKSKRK